MTDRLTPERLAQIRIKFGRLLNSAAAEHYALAERSRMGRELLVELDAVTAERDSAEARGRKAAVQRVLAWADALPSLMSHFADELRELAAELERGEDEKEPA